MKKKIVLSSAIIALLMLVSIQIVFMNTVTSDPIMQPGDADIGDLWLSELAVISETSTCSIDNVSIAHVTASDDWVLWGNRTGTVTADWDINVGDNHPEYHVIFSFAIYDVGDNNTEIGNTSYETTLNGKTEYDTNGTLSVALDLSYVPQKEKTRTLVCLLGAYARVNNTKIDAVNFTITASDRCVVAVDFEDPREPPPFSDYRGEANAAFSHRYAWIPGWDEEGRFSSEGEMLNTQTTFVVGNQTPIQQQQYNHTWYIGNISARRVGRFNFKNINWEEDELNTTWSEGADGFVRGVVNVNYTLQNNIYIWPVKYYIKLKATEPAGEEEIGDRFWMINSWLADEGRVKFSVGAYNETTSGGDCSIDVGGKLYIWSSPFLIKTVNLYNRGYQIHINQSINQDIPNADNNFYWEESVAYCNATSSTLTVSSSQQSGITTVKVAISDLLIKSENEYIETFSADRGNMRVEFTCGIS